MATASLGPQANVGKSELLRGIPDFNKTPVRGSRGFAAVNPIPASVQRQGSQPKNGHDVARELRKRAGAEDKVRWLASIPEEAFATIFRVEIDAELLQKMLEAMLQACTGASEGREELCKASCGVLVALTKQCSRALGFAASFAGAPDKRRAEELLQALSAAGCEKADVEAIRAGLLGSDEDDS
eukprot:TRINITY_DN15067_c1_g1_i1.p1 TRINITY_DN15067_c1_g1~~TRINITY_DN15067_c1_g1_i1.p1  ORF type:complete len:184 (-),score=44.62 TRINITY_DN15067_c1_g1_i1:181-732(-)